MELGSTLLMSAILVFILIVGLILGGAFVTVGYKRRQQDDTNDISNKRLLDDPEVSQEFYSILDILSMNNHALSEEEGDQIEKHIRKILKVTSPHFKYLEPILDKNQKGK